MAPEATVPSYDLMEIAMRFGKATRLMQQARLHAKLSAEAGIALEKPALSILGFIQRAEEPPRVGEIAAGIGVEGPHVTRHLKKLETDGLVRKIPDLKDRRACSIALTPEGAEAWERYCGRIRGWMAEALESWPEEDRQMLGRLLERYVDDVTAKLTSYSGSHTAL